jgi:8-oxo-dGTP pyrophosphatase MutT (NUDIX family)
VTEARPPRDSATVLLLRDEPGGLEVFMVRRHLASDFVGGAYVFPGGGLDAGDADPAMLARLAGVAPEAAAKLGLDADRARAHWVTAIRETFEEAGILLAGPGGRPASMATPAERAHWGDRRAALLEDRLGWNALVADEDLTLAGGLVGYWSHWVTPEGTPKRFSTRFFVAEVPADQEAMADEQEVEAGVWIRPGDALEARARGEMTLIFPTVKTLEELAAYGKAADVVAASAQRTVVTNLPRIVVRDGEAAVLLPGDPGYDEAAGAPPPAFDPSKL